MLTVSNRGNTMFLKKEKSGYLRLLGLHGGCLNVNLRKNTTTNMILTR